MARGRVEARITVPTGGWSVSLTITAIGGPYTVTVAAGGLPRGTSALVLSYGLSAAGFVPLRAA